MADANVKTVYLGTGRRKTAVARVRLSEGNGKITVNGRTLQDYFPEEKDRAAVVGPLELTELLNRLNTTITVCGGGLSGQAGAVSQGVARAIKTMFAPEAGVSGNVITASGVVRKRFGNVIMVRYKKKPGAAPTVATPAPADSAEEAEGAPEAPVEVSLDKKLRDSGFLTRDSRMKERKKYGRKGARKSFQFSKR